MKLNEAYISLKSKFTSGNNIEVERTVITKEEWKPIEELIYLVILKGYENGEVDKM